VSPVLRISGRWFHTREQAVTASKRRPALKRDRRFRDGKRHDERLARQSHGRGQRLRGSFRKFSLLQRVSENSRKSQRSFRISVGIGGPSTRGRSTSRRARRDFGLPWLRRLDRAIDIGLEFHEILAEHFDKLFRGRLKSLFVRPGFNRIEDIRVDALPIKWGLDIALSQAGKGRVRRDSVLIFKNAHILRHSRPSLTRPAERYPRARVPSDRANATAVRAEAHARI
jgi:hypothetical protein